MMATITSTAYDLIEDISIAILNIVLMFFGLTLVNIRNHTPYDLLFTVEGNGGHLFEESVNMLDWEDYVIAKGCSKILSFGLIDNTPRMMLNCMALYLKLDASAIFSFRKVVTLKMANVNLLTVSSLGIEVSISSLLIRFEETKLHPEYNMKFLEENKILLAHYFLTGEDEFEYCRESPTEIEYSNSIMNHCKFDYIGKVCPLHDWIITLNSDHTWKYLDRVRPGNEYTLKHEQYFPSYSSGPVHLAIDEELFSLIANTALLAKFSLKELRFVSPISVSKKHSRSKKNKIVESNYNNSQSDSKLVHPDNYQTATELMSIGIRAARLDVMKRFFRRFFDAYNEYGLLIIYILTSPEDSIAIVVLVLGSVTLSLCNGGKDFPEERPGEKWWGSGNEVNETDSWLMNGGNYVDSMLRSGVSYLLTSLLNLAVLGNQFKIVGWPNAIVFGTAEAYLCAYSFILACICENTFREKNKPLGQLRGAAEAIWGVEIGRIAVRPLIILLETLCLAAPVVINIIIFTVPSNILVPIIGFLVFYVGMLARFVAEPKMFMFAYNRSNLKFIMDLIFNAIGYSFYFFTCKFEFAGLREFYKNYVQGFYNNYIILAICCVAFSVSIYLISRYSTFSTE